MASSVNMIRYPDTMGTRSQTETMYVGFSWTCLFFSWIVPLVRGDYVAGVSLAALWFLTLIVGLSLFINIGMAIFYNKYYIQKKKSEGWVEASVDYYQTSV